jgi:hypothetical protein
LNEGWIELYPPNAASFIGAVIGSARTWIPFAVLCWRDADLQRQKILERGNA